MDLDKELNMEMTKDGTIRTAWSGWADADKCPLCEREGPGIANIYRKGHRRGNGIMLETGLSYCEDCYKKPECEIHWQKWWAEEWKSQEQVCEDNWQKHGIYGNCGGYYGIPSMHFGYAKTDKV